MIIMRRIRIKKNEESEDKGAIEELKEEINESISEEKNTNFDLHPC
jgi:transcriptional regulator CtsR